MIFYLFIYFRTKTSLSLLPRDFKPSKKILFEVLKIGVPSAASSILMQNVAHSYGDYVISAYGVASKMISMAFMLVLGYVSGYMPFVGYNYGAKKYSRMLSALKFVMISSTCVCIVFLIPFIFFSRAFMGAFTPEEDIIEAGVQFLYAYAWCLPILGLQVSLMCTFQSTGNGVKSLIINLGRQCLFNMPLIVLFNAIWEFKGLTYAGPVADIFTFLLAVLFGIPLLLRLGREAAENMTKEESM